MPYRWITQNTSGDCQVLALWPHESLAPKGFATFIGTTCVLLLIPLFAVLGSVVLWAILPFLLIAIGGVWFALERNHKDAQVLEKLTLTKDRAHLVRHTPSGDTLEWGSNIYWVRVDLHRIGGPVPQYVTLKGNGREVEIGAFLSEQERTALYGELVSGLAKARG
jgi:uncharacterized membrane protein